ncbi:hypothetical protein AMTRI_Chr07g78810 [Amborella trichopoda]
MAKSSSSPEDEFLNIEENKNSNPQQSSSNNRGGAFKRSQRSCSQEQKSPTSHSSTMRWMRASRSQQNPWKRGVNSRWWCFGFSFPKGVLQIIFLLGFIVFVFLVVESLMMKRSSRLGFIGHPLETGPFSFAAPLRFYSFELDRRFAEKGRELEILREQPRLAVRPPLLAIVMSSMDADASSLMLITLGSNLQLLGYKLQVFAFVVGKTLGAWEKIGCRVSILDDKSLHSVDWTNFDGVLLTSLEEKIVVSSLLQEPFLSVPLIWIVQEETLGERLPVYEENGWIGLVSEWISAFSRANVLVFPDFTLPMMYSKLDTGNFFVIPGLPVEAWESEASVLRDVNQLRKDSVLQEDDLIIFVTGSPFAYTDLPLDYDVAVHAIGSFLKDSHVSFKFFFFNGKSKDGDLETMQELTSRLDFPVDSMRFYGEDDYINDVLSMADIVLYGSIHEEQVLPPLFLRAMSFGIPVMAPDLPFVRRYIQNGTHGLIYPMNDTGRLIATFSFLVTDGKLNNYAHMLGYSGRLHARNMFALDFITTYAKLLENVLQFPSDAMLPKPVSRLPAHEVQWAWDLIGNEIAMTDGQILGEGVRKPNRLHRNSNVMSAIEESWKSSMNASDDQIAEDIPTQQDWDDARDTEISEEYERREMEELNGQMETDVESWEDVRRNTKKFEKVKVESNERDEGELERTGLSLCIYEVYDGAGAWPFLHRDSLYRGLSLAPGSRRTNSDDLEAVERLPLLNNTYYRDAFCELGGLFAIANGTDNIHKHPWIGFQSWRASGRKVCFLTSFAEAFRLMYALPSNETALPPMPSDGEHWSALHSWAMPTRSFLEFVMFSRMFTSSLLDSQRLNPQRNDTCLLGSSKIEKRQCYCRVLEVLVNVWAYHSARKMVYIDPISGLLEEQHPVEKRIGSMWVAHFNNTLLKDMDEEWAEQADDGDHPPGSTDGGTWVWPSTGEVYCKVIFDREQAEKYRAKMEKTRKAMEKLLERQKYGYKQKTLGG